MHLLVLSPAEGKVGLNGCGYAAGIGIRKAVMDEIKKLIIGEGKREHNQLTIDETSSATE